jgi:hypothetical protein
MTEIVQFTVKYWQDYQPKEETFPNIDAAIRFAWFGSEHELSCCHEIWCDGELLMDEDTVQSEGLRLALSDVTTA